MKTTSRHIWPVQWAMERIRELFKGGPDHPEHASEFTPKEGDPRLW